MYRIEELEPRNYDFMTDKSKAEITAALKDPATDFFSDGPYMMRRAKAQVGNYVAKQGFPVPLITEPEEWQDAMDNGEAMIRSDSGDDYQGYRGLFSSVVLPEIQEGDDAPYEWRGLTLEALKHLRSGAMAPSDYMKYFVGRYRTWPESLAFNLAHASGFNAKLSVDIPNASLWRYVPGSNVSIFGDPHVEGRYHVGFTPTDEIRGHITGGFRIESDEHNLPVRFRKHDVDFVAQSAIEAYEEVAALPLFDIEQRPVMELQLANDGTVHFLQYYKTGHRKAYTDPADLPFSPDTDIVLDMVRGTTEPQGEELKLFIAPKKFERGMIGQATYLDILGSRGIEAQIVSKLSKFVLHRAYISFQDNHFNSAPLFMPPLAAGMAYISESSNDDLVEKAGGTLRRITHELYHDYNRVGFVNIHVTSNGHQAVIASDWEPHIVAYDDLREAT